jgi:uncharacterized membrane protein HdeD (DUF308 family)
VFEKFVNAGAWLLIPLGLAHAVHVGLSADVEPYLWGGSLFLIVQGIITLLYLRAGHSDTSFQENAESSQR